MTPIHVVGVGLSGMDSLMPPVQIIVKSADLLLGSQRQLSYFDHLSIEQWVIDDFALAFERLKHYLADSRLAEDKPYDRTIPQNQTSREQKSVVILATGDPLFFGLGRLLLKHFSTEWLTFHPNLSSIQLAFNRLKIAWQDAHCVSVHGRAFDELGALLQKGAQKIAVLTDPSHSPGAIARYVQSLDLAMTYQFWVCENLGAESESVRCFGAEDLISEICAPLSVLVLLRQKRSALAIEQYNLPMFGLPDHAFQSFDDRPGLMTKREVRMLALGELGSKQAKVCWDIGAGTGAMSVELARLMPHARIYALEPSLVGIGLIERNCMAFGASNVRVIQGKAPDALASLPKPDCIFIGGSGQHLSDILTVCEQSLNEQGVIVLAIATLEHLQTTITWFQPRLWTTRILHVQLSRSTPIANLTRLKPLNPVYLVTAVRA